MKKSIRRMFTTSVEKDDSPYEGVILHSESCTSMSDDPQLIFKLIQDGHVCRVRSFILKNPACLMVRNDLEAMPLHYAAKYGHLEIVFLIVNESTDEAEEETRSLLARTDCVNYDKNSFVAPSQTRRELRNVFLGTASNVLNAQDGKGSTALHWAIFKNQVDSVKILLSRGANPNLLNFYRLAPLHMAIQLHYNTIVEELLNYSTTDINLEGDLGNSPIMCACYKDNSEALVMLFNHGAKLCKRNRIGCYPIHMTAFAGSLKCMDLVLKKGEEFGFSIEDHINFTDNEKSSPLHVAVQNGRLEIVKACIEYGAKIDLKQNDNATALHFASTQGATEIVKFMVSSYTGDKKVVELPDGNNETPLHKSCLFDHAELAEYLISMGANIDIVDNELRTPLLLATSCSSWKTVNLLLEKGANVKLVDSFGRNFLHLTVLQPGGLRNINPEILQKEEIKLLVSDEDADGCTPLHYACRHGVPNSVNNLMGLNVSLYSKSKDKRSALHFAACYGRYNTCERVLRFIPDARLLNDADEKGMTPLHLAAQNGHDKIVFLLLKKGALMLSDYRGWTGLHYAAHGGYTRTIQTFLDTSLSLIDKADKDKNTALHLSAKEGHAKAVALLLESGAAINLNANDASFFHEAIRGGCKDVVYAAIQSERWEEVLIMFSHASNYKCPILEMVYHLPESLKFLLDRCMNESPGDKKSQDFCIEYKFRYLQCPLQIKKASEKKANITYEPLTTLNAMVQHNRVELLSHPVCKEYLTMKWRAYGFKAHILNLAVYSLGLIPLTLLIMSAVAPEGHSNNSTSHSKLEPLHLQDSYFTRTCMGIVMFMSAFGMFKEIVQMGQQKLGYLMDGSNLIDWTIHISSIMFVSSICTKPLFVAFWQWQAGAIAVFLSWVNFLIYLQRFETCGIYIVMFWEILRTLIRIVVIFFFLILAFGLSFFVVLYPQTPFGNPLLALMQTFTMMLGDINYQDGFLHPFLDNQIENPVFTFVHLIVFTLLIPILLMNLLIGLAVGDIAEVQRNAALKRIAMQVSLHTNLEKKLPYWFLKRVDEVTCVVYPNRPRIWGHAVNSSVLKYFLVCDGFKIETPSNDTTMEVELWKQKNRLKDLSTVMQKQHELIKLIIQKMEIVSEAEDEDNHDLFQNNKPKKQRMPERKESKWDCVIKAVKCKSAH